MFENIAELFKNKPLLVCVNKVDVRRIEDLSEDRRQLFEKFKEKGIPVVEMSTITEEGIMKVKTEVSKEAFSLFPSVWICV